MQIMGKRSKILLMGLLALMLITLGASFAVWDGQAALAATGNAASYANAKVGDVIQFGRYWQKAMPTGYDDKDPIEWIVVDKNERTGQLTLLSKYILAYGSYFGTWYRNKSDTFVDGGTGELIDSIPYNQAWSESTARAFLNNLERFDLGGDKFEAPSETFAGGLNNSARIVSTKASKKLLPSVGFSNSRYFTGIAYKDSNGNRIEAIKALTDKPAETGLYERYDYNELYYQRPKVTNVSERLARNGFLDEAFSPDEKQMIVPKEIPGQISHRWPANTHTLDSAEYVPGTKDKIWLPSAEELNIKEGFDWKDLPDSWTNPSELESSTPFEYFKNYTKYTGKTDHREAVKATHTAFAGAAKSLGNYSIPGWITEVGNNSDGHYWTRSAVSYWYFDVRVVNSSGQFNSWGTYHSRVGVRPAIILQY